MSKNEKFVVGSGNVFLDLGFPKEEALALSVKSRLFDLLQSALKQQGKSQTALAKMLGVPQPKISDILNGKMTGFSIDRVINYLAKLDYDIILDARPLNHSKGIKKRSASR